MWSGFDPELLREFGTLRQMAKLVHQTPTREWPLVYVAERQEVLIVREWPDGSITAFSTPPQSDSSPSDR